MNNKNRVMNYKNLKSNVSPNELRNVSGGWHIDIHIGRISINFL